MSKKIFPGKVCTFDKDNISRQRSDGVYEVTVEKLKKWRPFGKSIWVVTINDDTKNYQFDCIETLLTPEPVSAIRYPMDFPTFKNTEIEALNKVINSSKSGSLKIFSDNELQSIINLREKLSYTIGYDKRYKR